MRDVEQERAAFEAWATDNGEYPKAVERDSAGNYRLLKVHTDWIAWQAGRAALAAAPATPKILLDGSTLYELNSAGTNRWSANVQPGHEDDGNRTSAEACRAIAESLAAAPVQASDREIAAPMRTWLDAVGNLAHAIGVGTIASTTPVEAVAEIINKAADQLRAQAAALAAAPVTCQTYGSGVQVPCAECNQVLVDSQELAELRALAAQVVPLDTAIQQLQEQKDGAYLERNRCVAALARMAIALGQRAGRAKTAIDGWDPAWHGCIYIDLPTGQVSWHYHESQSGLFTGLPEYAGRWDGHDTPTKYVRLAAAFPVLAAAQQAPAAAEPVAYMIRDKTIPGYEPWPTRPDSDAFRCALRRDDFEVWPLCTAPTPPAAIPALTSGDIVAEQDDGATFGDGARWAYGLAAERAGVSIK